MGFTGSNDQSGSEQPTGGGGLIATAGEFLGGLIAGLNSDNTTSWDSPAHKAWTTQYVTNEGLAWLDTNAPGHRMNYPISVDAHGVFLAMKGWSPAAGDPHRAREMEIIQQIQAGASAGSVVPGLAGTGAGNVGSGGSGGGGGAKLKAVPFVMIWPWEKGAFTIALWYHWLIWIGVPVVILVILWMMFSKKGKARRRARKERRRNRRSSRSQRR